jgi:hypothetical protein
MLTAALLCTWRLLSRDQYAGPPGNAGRCLTYRMILKHFNSRTSPIPPITLPSMDSFDTWRLRLIDLMINITSHRLERDFTLHSRDSDEAGLLRDRALYQREFCPL